MATTTATITLASTDLLSDELSLASTATLTAAGNSTGIKNTGGLARRTTGSTNIYTLFDGDAYGDGAHKIYLKNTETTAGLYFRIFMQDEQIGKLYAGDWAFFPWEANADSNDIKIGPSTSASHTLEFMLFNE